MPPAALTGGHRPTPRHQEQEAVAVQARKPVSLYGCKLGFAMGYEARTLPLRQLL